MLVIYKIISQFCARNQLKKMTKRLLITAIIPCLFFSCAREQELSEIVNEGVCEESITLNVSHEPGQTKTCLSGLNVLWNTGDCISVFSSGVNSSFTTKSSGSANATFTGKAAISDKYYILYPYNAEASISSNVIDCTIPYMQVPVKNSFDPAAALMAGITDEEDAATLRNACAFIKFELAGDDVTLVYIQTTGDGESLTGSAELTVANDGTHTFATGSGTLRNAVSLSQPADAAFEPGVYYACVFPNDISGVRVIFHYADGSTGSKVKKTTACTLTRNFITDFGVIDDNVTRKFEDDGTTDESYSSSSYGFNYESLGKRNHPRLFLDETGFNDLKQKVTTDAASNVFLKMLSDNIISNADSYLSEAVPAYTASDNLSEARLGLKHIFACAYAFHITRDSKYFNKAKADMLQFCSWSDWHPEQYLCVGETSMGMAIGYDWLYGYFTNEERELFREKMYAYVLGTYKDDANISKFSNANNWNEVCWGGLSAAAIALMGKKVTVGATTYGNSNLIELLEMCVNPSNSHSNAYQLPRLYGPDGCFDEGYNYWNYGTGYEIALIKALETAFGKSATGVTNLVNASGFLSTDAFLQFMESPLGGNQFATFGFSDGGASAAELQWPLYWFAEHKTDYSILSNEFHKYQAGAYTPSGCKDRMFPLLPAIAKDLALDAHCNSPVYPTSKLWSGGNGMTEIIMARDKWSGTNDAYVGFKAGYPNRSHGHMDIGSFVFDYNGERWSHDIPLAWTYSAATERIRQYDASKEYNVRGQGSGRWWFFFTNNSGHSTISVMNGPIGSKSNKSDQLVGSSSSRATIVSTINTSTETGGRMNLTPMYSDCLSSIYRTVKIVREGGTFKKLVVIDEITTNSSLAPQIQWRMLTPASVTNQSGYQELTQNAKTMYLKTVVSGNVSSPVYTVWDAADSSVSGWVNPVDRDYTVTKGYHMAGFTATIQKSSSITMTTTITDNPDNL